MPKAIRQFKSRRPYEICFRAREGLPFAVTSYMRLLIKAILARTQRDFKIKLCHHIFMGNHPHILAVFKDSEQAKRFYMEVEKKLTDAIKRLLGLEYLSLWEGTPKVIEIGDLESAIKMIAYYYANPAAAHLVESIEEYPGLSSWQEFISHKETLSACASEELPWIRLYRIPLLPQLAVSKTQDEFLTERLRKENGKKTHTLELFPNAWMECFGITSDEEVARINERIIKKLRHNEEVCRKWRARNGRKVMGAGALYKQPLMAAHTPKKKGRRIFCIAATKALRCTLIAQFKAFSAVCRHCYESWRDGEVLVPWPPGAFVPSLPPRANAIE